MVRLFCSLFVILAGTSATLAQTKHDLRGPGPKSGDVLRSQSKVIIKDAELVLSANGQDIKITQTMTILNEEEETYLEVKDRQVTKLRTKVIQDTIKTLGSLGGQDINEEKKGDLEGEIVSSVRTKDGKWTHALIDGKPNDEQKKALADRDGPENTDDMFPAMPVAVGHAWEVDASKIKSLTGNSFKDVSGKMKLKFLRTEKINGEECAVIETSGTLKGKVKSEDGELPDVEMKLTSLGWHSLKTGIEVKGQFEGTIKMSGKMKMDGEEIEMKLEGPIQGTSTIQRK